jgi:hypothetical protein
MRAQDCSSQCYKIEPLVADRMLQCLNTSRGDTSCVTRCRDSNLMRTVDE